MRDELEINSNKKTTGNRILTIFYYKDIGPQHLYKDVGSIPLGLAKYCNWDSTFAYVNWGKVVKNREYERFVSLVSIKLYWNPLFSAALFLWNHVNEYEILNVYHLIKRNLLLTTVAKIRNPSIKIYVKTDSGRKSVPQMRKGRIYNICVQLLAHLHLLPDLCTVETKAYVNRLKRTPLYKGRVRYLPNGFWRDESIPENLECQKEKIILTVGRLGTPEKNTELLLDSFAAIPAAQRMEWNLVLVGSYTPEIFQKAQRLITRDKTLKGRIQFTGNISEKKILNQYYLKAMIFCFPSRWESFGLVLVEAIHHGCFPIVTDCCDAFYDILDQGKYGDIIPNEDALALTKALERAMSDEQATVRQGMAAKQYVDQHFDWEKIIYRLQEYLNDVDRKK